MTFRVGHCLSWPCQLSVVQPSMFSECTSPSKTAGLLDPSPMEVPLTTKCHLIQIGLSVQVSPRVVIDDLSAVFGFPSFGTSSIRTGAAATFTCLITPSDSWTLFANQVLKLSSGCPPFCREWVLRLVQRQTVKLAVNFTWTNVEPSEASTEGLAQCPCPARSDHPKSLSHSAGMHPPNQV